MKNYCSWCHQADDHTCPELDFPRAKQVKLACAQCQRPILLVGVIEAAKIANHTRKTMYEWIEKKWISAIHSASGRPMICYSSLFLPTSQAHKLFGKKEAWEYELEEYEAEQEAAPPRLLRVVGRA